MLLLTWRSPEPEVQPPPQTLREAIWLPLLGVLGRHRALEILAFVVLYKFSDQLTQSLTRPFLIDMGYTAKHRGIALATVAVVATIGGAFIGGFVTTLAGLGHALWIFGFLQVFSNGGYYLLSLLDRPRLVPMYAATSFEVFSSGLGSGAFGSTSSQRSSARGSRRRWPTGETLLGLIVTAAIGGLLISARHRAARPRRGVIL